MKSNQERSNECLPPKKREIHSSTLQSDRRSSPTMAPPSDAPRSDNMPWLESSLGAHRSHSQSEYKPLPSSTHSSPSSSSVRPVSSLPTLYTSPQNTGGTVHYTQLPPNLQFIASPYPTTYPSYIPSQIFTPPLPPPPQRPSHSETAPSKQERLSIDRTSMPPPPTDSVLSHHIQRTASLSHHHPPHSLHSQHALGHSMTQVMVQYPDGASRKEEGSSRPRELHNGELERGRRFGAESKPGSKLRDYEARQLVMSSDYTTHDPLRTRTSVLLNSHTDHQLARASPDKHSSQGSIVSGKPVRTPSLSNNASSFTFPPPPSVESLKAAIGTVSPQTVIQTTHNSTDALSLALPYTQQQPIIGYIAGTQHTPISYTSLPQHLLIPGAQQVIIPVSSGVTALETVTSHVTSSTHAAQFPTTYITATPPKGDTLDGSLYHQGVPVIPGQLHLPVLPVSPELVTSSSSAPPPLSTSNTTVPHALPPYFIKGSIIQLADGELKRVEDLKTEDFIQSAEISSELKIDSSTVERIEGSHTSPSFAVVQFSVGEHRAQVSVEVLVEYPFFVFGQGWSSCCPDRTTQLLELPCTKLSVGDVCISLTLKNVRNGALKKPIELSNTPLLKPPTRACSQDAPQTSRQHREKENGINQRVSSGSGTDGNVKNGEVLFGDRPGQVAEVSSRRQSGGRKRRWSAPEGRKVERLEEEPPVTLPKPSFIPHEVKVSIEGRSNIGK